jgi:hypothetical protein
MSIVAIIIVMEEMTMAETANWLLEVSAAGHTLLAALKSSPLMSPVCHSLEA